MRYIGESDGNASGDTFASELSDEIAEEEIDLICGRKAVNVAEKLRSEDLRVHGRNSHLETAGVVGAERGTAGSVREAMMIVDQHVTTLTFGTDMLAVGIDGGAN